MRRLDSYMSNPFDARLISAARLEPFSTDNLERMRANNPAAVLDDEIAAMAATFAMASFYAAFTRGHDQAWATQGAQAYEAVSPGE